MTRRVSRRSAGTFKLNFRRVEIAMGLSLSLSVYISSFFFDWSKSKRDCFAESPRRRKIFDKVD